MSGIQEFCSRARQQLPTIRSKESYISQKDEWVRVENAFEGLVDRHTFEVVANLMERDTRKSAAGIALLSGLLECADCHQSMVRKSPNGKNYYYVCSTSLYEKECTPHSISENKLIPVIKKCIQYYISIIVELDEILKYVQTQSVPKQKILEADKLMKVLRQECDRIMQIKKNLYESYSEGFWTKKNLEHTKKAMTMNC